MTTTYTVRYEDEATYDEAVAFECETLEEAIAYIRKYGEAFTGDEALYIVAPDECTVIEFED